jgi:hypothetical protein
MNQFFDAYNDISITLEYSSIYYDFLDNLLFLILLNNFMNLQKPFINAFIFFFLDILNLFNHNIPSFCLIY